MALPEALINPGDEGYDAMYALWQQGGNPRQLLNHREGWAYRVYKPDGVPVFCLECSHPDLSVVMATRLMSWGSRGELPIVDVNPE
jgi:hypothetical protein